MGKSKKSQDHADDSNLITKPSFGSPFDTSWPGISKEDNKRILDELKQEIPKYLHGRIIKSKERRDVKTKEEDHCQLNKERKSFNEFLLIGINAVTKALEKGPLSLVLVCKSTKPSDISKHLIPLCVMRKTEACCVSGLSNAISTALGLKSVLAVGFKVKERNPLADLICFITDKIPTLDVSWLSIWEAEKEKTKPEGSRISTETYNKQMDATNKTVESSCKETMNTGENVDGGIQTTEDNATPVNGSEDIAVHKDQDSSSGELVCSENIGKRRKINDVKYKLVETNYKMKKVPRPVKKS